MCRNVSFQAMSRLLLRQLPSISNHIAKLPTLPAPILTFSISTLPSLLPPLNQTPPLPLSNLVLSLLARLPSAAIISFLRNRWTVKGSTSHGTGNLALHLDSKPWLISTCASASSRPISSRHSLDDTAPDALVIPPASQIQRTPC